MLNIKELQGVHADRIQSFLKFDFLKFLKVPMMTKFARLFSTFQSIRLYANSYLFQMLCFILIHSGQINCVQPAPRTRVFVFHKIPLYKAIWYINHFAYEVKMQIIEFFPKRIVVSLHKGTFIRKLWVFWKCSFKKILTWTEAGTISRSCLEDIPEVTGLNCNLSLL